MLDPMLRRSVLTVAELAPVRWLFEKHGMKFGVDRFIAGESLPEALAQVKRLNERGLLATLDLLGENVSDARQAEQTAAAIAELFPVIERHGLRANVSVKLTQLGLKTDPRLCLKLMERIAGEAAACRNFVRIDMEDSSVTQATVDLFRQLRSGFGPERIGLVLQSYLFRSEQDVREIGTQGTNLRIVKGAYREPPDVAYRRKREVDAAYVRLVRAHLEQGGYAAVATHDPRMIGSVLELTERLAVPRHRFEFQMLYGIAVDLQRSLADAGYAVRVYTPFGRHWYPYFTRRIAERPANFWFVAKHLFRSSSDYAGQR